VKLQADEDDDDDALGDRYENSAKAFDQEAEILIIGNPKGKQENLLMSP